MSKPYRIALRPDNADGDPFDCDPLDDIVIHNIVTLHMEAMDDDQWIMSCHLADSDETLTLCICREGKKIVVMATEFPNVTYEQR